MLAKVKVTLYRRPPRKNYFMQYREPGSNRKVQRSTGTTNKVEAGRIARDWERELQQGKYAKTDLIAWEAFRDRHEDEFQPGCSRDYAAVFNTVFNSIEKILEPVMLTELNGVRLSKWQAELRAAGKSEQTINTYLKHLRAALNWAVDAELLAAAPVIKRPPRVKGTKKKRRKKAKGRAINLEEFERMLGKIELIVGEAAAPSWNFYLESLFWSGLRLSESLEVYWDQRDDKLSIDMTGQRPLLRIPAELDKGGEDRDLPIAPEFAELLEKIPEQDRQGRLFKLTDRNGEPREMTSDWVGRIVSRIGKAAGIVVHRRTKTVNGEAKTKIKYASAHDLRRSFGSRWARRVMPVVLQELMRHENIETTMAYYVDQDTEQTAEIVWAAYEVAMQAARGNTGELRAEAVA